MRRTPPLFLIIIAAVAGFLVLGAIFGGGGWRHDDNSRITIVNPDGSSGSGSTSGSSSSVTVDGQQVAPGSVVVIDNGRRGPGFFPFFPLLPILFFGFLIFLFTRRARHGWGGPGWGPNRWNGGPDDRGPGNPPRQTSSYAQSPEHAWFNREHEASTPPAAPTMTPPASAAPAAKDAPTTDAQARQSGADSLS